jgi:acetate kinase
MITLAINCGNSSIKCMVDAVIGKTFCLGMMEYIGTVTSIFRHENRGNKLVKETLIIDDQTKTIRSIMDFMVYRIITVAVGTFKYLTQVTQKNEPLLFIQAMTNVEDMDITMDPYLNDMDNCHGDIKNISPVPFVSVYVIPTNEELVIVQGMAKIATAARQSIWV